MNQNTTSNRERLLQLMVDHATEGLEVTELNELSDLLIEFPDLNPLGLERAAAALNLVFLPEVAVALPGRLRDRVLTNAGRYFGAAGTSALRISSEPDGSNPHQAGRSRSWRERVAYFVAAASLFLAMVGWWQVAAVKQMFRSSAAQQYASFVQETPDVVRIPWVGKEQGYLAVTGEAVWSSTRHEGFLRFVGLAPNDPAASQYQLWIVDPTRDKHPIDGGVFDVNSAGEVIVPINAKLDVDQPKVFAVTLEKPGGVVVSDGPLLLVGTVPS